MTSTNTVNLNLKQVSISLLEVTTTNSPVVLGDKASSYAIGLTPNGSGEITIPLTGNWWWVPFDDTQAPERITGTWKASCSCEEGVGTCTFESTGTNLYTGSCVPDPPGDSQQECRCCRTTWYRVDYSETKDPGVLVDTEMIDFNGVVYQ